MVPNGRQDIQAVLHRGTHVLARDDPILTHPARVASGSAIAVLRFVESHRSLGRIFGCTARVNGPDPLKRTEVMMDGVIGMDQTTNQCLILLVFVSHKHSHSKHLRVEFIIISCEGGITRSARWPQFTRHATHDITES